MLSLRRNSNPLTAVLSVLVLLAVAMTANTARAQVSAGGGGCQATCLADLATKLTAIDIARKALLQIAASEREALILQAINAASSVCDQHGPASDECAEARRDADDLIVEINATYEETVDSLNEIYDEFEDEAFDEYQDCVSKCGSISF